MTNCDEELALILAALAEKQKDSPLDFLELMPGQQAAVDSKASTVLVFGGNRAGKTTPDAAIVIRAALSRPRMKIWVCGETFQDSIAIQQTKINQLVPKKRVRYGTFDDINGYTNRKLQFDNGSLISFKSYDQGRTAFQSDDLDLVICDEEPPLEIIKEIKMRLIDRNGRLVISMTSLKGITDFIRDYFEDCDILETRYAPLLKQTLPVRGRKGSVEIFFLWTTDNKYIDQNRLMDEIKLMGESDIKARIYGMPVNLAGKIYMSFGRDTHVIPLDDVPTTGNQLWHVLDPHDRKPWAMGWYLVNKNETVYCVDEYPNGDFNEMLYDDKTFEEYAVIIREKEDVLRRVFNCGGRIRRLIDPNFGHKTVQLAQRKGGQSKTTPVKELERLGLRYRDSIDALESGHLEVRKWLHWEKKALSDGRQQFTVMPRFLISDNCRNHINHLMRYSRRDVIASDGDVKDKVSPQQKYKDYCDLVRYLLMANPHWIGEEKWTPPKKKVY